MKKLYIRFLIVAMIIIDLIYIYNAFINQVYDRLPAYFALFFVLAVPWLVHKIFKVKINDNMKILYFTFILFADFGGCVLGLYVTTEWFDKLAHLLSGILTAIIALLLMNRFKYKEKKLQTIIYTLAISSLVAVAWEIFEYSADSFFGMTLQHNLETGVHDTMGDMIAAVIGNLLFLVLYFSPKHDFFQKFIVKLLP